MCLCNICRLLGSYGSGDYRAVRGVSMGAGVVGVHTWWFGGGVGLV